MITIPTTLRGLARRLLVPDLELDLAVAQCDLAKAYKQINHDRDFFLGLDELADRCGFPDVPLLYDRIEAAGKDMLAAHRALNLVVAGDCDRSLSARVGMLVAHFERQLGLLVEENRLLKRERDEAREASERRGKDASWWMLATNTAEQRRLNYREAARRLRAAYGGLAKNYDRLVHVANADYERAEKAEAEASALREQLAMVQHGSEAARQCDVFDELAESVDATHVVLDDACVPRVDGVPLAQRVEALRHARDRADAARAKAEERVAELEAEVESADGEANDTEAEHNRLRDGLRKVTQALFWECNDAALLPRDLPTILTRAEQLANQDAARACGDDGFQRPRVATSLADLDRAELQSLVIEREREREVQRKRAAHSTERAEAAEAEAAKLRADYLRIAEACGCHNGTPADIDTLVGEIVRMSEAEGRADDLDAELRMLRDGDRCEIAAQSEEDASMLREWQSSRRLVGDQSNVWSALARATITVRKPGETDPVTARGRTWTAADIDAMVELAYRDGFTGPNCLGCGAHNFGLHGSPCVLCGFVAPGKQREGDPVGLFGFRRDESEVKP